MAQIIVTFALVGPSETVMRTKLERWKTIMEVYDDLETTMNLDQEIERLFNLVDQNADDHAIAFYQKYVDYYGVYPWLLMKSASDSMDGCVKLQHMGKSIFAFPHSTVVQVPGIESLEREQDFVEHGAWFMRAILDCNTKLSRAGGGMIVVYMNTATSPLLDETPLITQPAVPDWLEAGKQGEV